MRPPYPPPRTRCSLTERGDEVAPELGGLPSQEEEPEEPHNDGVHRLVGELRVNTTDLSEIGGLRRPHRSGPESQKNTGWYQGIEFRIELGADVGSVAQHGHT